MTRPMRVLLFTELTDIIFSHFYKINGNRKSQQLHLSTCIQSRMTKHPSQKVMNFRHLLGCDTTEQTQNLIFDTQEQT